VWPCTRVSRGVRLRHSMPVRGQREAVATSGSGARVGRIRPTCWLRSHPDGVMGPAAHGAAREGATLVLSRLPALSSPDNSVLTACPLQSAEPHLPTSVHGYHQTASPRGVALMHLMWHASAMHATSVLLNVHQPCMRLHGRPCETGALRARVATTSVAPRIGSCSHATTQAQTPRVATVCGCADCPRSG
jgi:hypothetical protein